MRPSVGTHPTPNPVVGVNINLRDLSYRHHALVCECW